MRSEAEPKFDGQLTLTIARFLTELGIEIRPTVLNEETFLPGILVRNGVLLVDEAKLSYPGDLLHEAGHLAVTPSRLRAGLSGEVAPEEAEVISVETASIAWSYAALTHLKLDPKEVFHQGGYGGNSAGLLLSFSLGVYPGALDLQAMGMTATGDVARQLNVPPFPWMLKWLRD